MVFYFEKLKTAFSGIGKGSWKVRALEEHEYLMTSS